jgi:FixJ family two-component response regulator
MTMAQMTGDLLARELISIRPEMPIIVCTGYSDRIDTDIANEIGIRELVMKPVVMKDIANCIRRILDEEIAQKGTSMKTGS